MNVTVRFHKQLEIGNDLYKYRHYCQFYSEGMDKHKFEFWAKASGRDADALLLKSFVKHFVPHESGVYFLMNEGVVFYVGRTMDFKARLSQHADTGGLLHKADEVAFQFIEELPMQYVVEAVAIADFMPEDNKLGLTK